MAFPKAAREVMPLTERLGKYRMVLKQFDTCTKDLAAAGFIEDRDAQKREKFTLAELRRVDRALGALGAPPVPQLPPAGKHEPV